jgi:putative nucleotidyltransferase with HDIG domain
MRNEDEKRITGIFIEMVKYMGGAVSGLRLYPKSHPSVTKQLTELDNSLRKLLDNKDRLILALSRNIPVVDGIPVYEDNIHISTFRSTLIERGIEVIIIKSTVTKDELVPFLEVMMGVLKDAQVSDLNRYLESRQVKNILIKDVIFDERAKEAYFEAIETVAKTLADVRQGNLPDIEENRRVVRSIVNSILIDKNSLLSLSMIKNYNDYLYSHSVNVCILAASLAEQMGYSNDEISEIALAGLLHDIGKLKTPLTILLKPGKLNDTEWEAMKQHPYFGYQILSQLAGVSEKTVKMVYEHHMRPNPKGYPHPQEGAQPSSEGQIIAIADTYDACTTLRPYQNPLTPVDTIKLMKKMSRETKDFNLDLLKAFTDMMGIYPIGATVRLDTNEIALVSRYFTQRPAPLVRVFMDRDGSLIEEPIEVDLNDKDPETERPLRSITGEVDFNVRNIDLSKLLAGSGTDGA